ncbi:glycosyl hydrolase [Demequina sp. NBRC 110057]|uniref:glycosyl hydrolase n=1 Tax=Demequina sp. NBRC 110057 TaxID=1570346 RepID=UPI0011787B4C|nr:glycosyl hydrolase [Demequina sp. NBRC 110057]
MRAAPLTAVALASALALAACDGDAPAATPSSDAVAASATSAVADLPERELAPADQARVVGDLPAPTNRWYSGLVFGPGPYSAFGEPMSFTAVEGGLAVGLPRVQASADLIAGPAARDVTLQVDGAEGLPAASAADPVGATLDYTDGAGDTLVRASIAKGWPAVTLTAAADASITLSSPATTSADGPATLVIGETTYVLATDGGTVDGATLTLPEGATAQLAVVPDDGDPAAFAEALGAPVTQTTLQMGVDGDTATTSVTYADGGTVVAVPEDRADGLDCSLGTYETINGPLLACAADAVSWDVPRTQATTALDLSGIGQYPRAAIVEALQEAAASEPELPADTYFGGKALHRQAMLVSTAEALGEDTLADRLAKPLAEALRTWTETDGCESRDSRCFVYDTGFKGVTGLEASFGSEEFNDHHFHYGYFLSAAAIAVGHDASLAEDVGPVIDLLAEDIASPEASDRFPQLRSFDPVSGHAWASGMAPFGDGNNQESSSEAVIAWNGLAAWAEARGDQAMTDTATWLLSAEADAALTRYVRPDLSDFPDYAHDFVSLEWGGKREHATWFSPAEAAKLGIELIPMAPIQGATLGPRSDEDAQVIRDTATGAQADADEAGFGDYLLMYQALAGPDDAAQAWEDAVALPDDAIDDGNTRAAMLAFIAAQIG